ncbi:uncharacterized protein LOC122643461 [Telopea speciosissima]|uniref:uncharacterized protein LOC122643461 n=1 Tax=Telopea speciosissima TaxID=54955 RepID=UPI001CC5DB30|nr:uncharacterized protein LOC122643461 [Telopea speciosissima]
MADAELADVPWTGARYTWNNKGLGETRIACKLDRVLANLPWLESFPSSTTHFQHPLVLDHCLVVVSLGTTTRTWGTQFYFFNFGADHEDFLPLVQEVWDTPVSGGPLFTLVSKLSALKGHLKGWSHSIFHNLDQKVKDMEGELTRLQSLIAGDVWMLRFWLKKGSKNCIAAINDRDGNWLKNVTEIEQEAIRFFEDAFAGSPQVICPAFELQGDHLLDSTDCALLTRPFLVEEIMGVVFKMDNDSAPGVDRFGAYFFKKKWGIIGDENSFHDYRPIAVSPLLYRFIAKLLANRLKLVMDKVVGVNQSAFIEGRNITDNVLLAQELMNGYHLNKGMPRFAAKVDLRKVYDSVQWSFLFTLLLRLNFPATFITWLTQCVVNPRASVANAIWLREEFQKFSALSSLIVNQGKFSIFFANCASEVESFFAKAGLPVHYLGVLLASRSLRLIDYAPLVTRLEERLGS